MAQGKIIPGAEPFYFPGGPTGCLLVHGFTGTPKEMRLLGEYLNAQGHTVLGVRLAGHATDLQDMIRSRYPDWMASVEDGWNLLQNSTERIFIMGLSMGGVLSLTQAARLQVAGVVAMSTPYRFPKKWVNQFPWLLPLIAPFVPKTGKSEGVWFTPQMAESHVSYSHNPVRSAYELYKLLEIMRASLSQVRVPALVIHSKDDDYVFEQHAEPLFADIGSTQKELIWVDKANHVITRDGDTSRVFEPIAAFIQKYS